MIGEAACHPLKARRERPESSKQAEIALAWVSTILSICRPWRGRPDRGWKSLISATASEAPVRVELPPISVGYG
jgi:hypothetical protein